MPKQTTHVLEIEKGVGEPTFIPLAEGEELQPISIGKRGQWRLEGPRVLDVHAYVYFDGKALFAQSADDTSPVQVSGQRIGKQWTEVQLPCRLFIGSAILRCRSLLEEDVEVLKGRAPGERAQSLGMMKDPIQPRGIVPRHIELDAAQALGGVAVGNALNFGNEMALVPALELDLPDPFAALIRQRPVRFDGLGVFGKAGQLDLPAHAVSAEELADADFFVCGLLSHHKVLSY